MSNKISDIPTTTIGHSLFEDLFEDTPTSEVAIETLVFFELFDAKTISDVSIGTNPLNVLGMYKIQVKAHTTKYGRWMIQQLDEPWP